MAKKLFKKKSFWAKLPQKSKIGLIAFVLVLIGAAAAYALSQTDSSLQSKASLVCDSSCKTTCASVKDPAQNRMCLSRCMEKCNPTTPNLPPYCKNLERYTTMAEKKGGLTQFQLNTVKRIAERQGALSAQEKSSSLKTSDQFMTWYRDRCMPTKCQPDWTKVISQGTRPVPEYFKMSDQSEFARQTTIPKYFWPNACGGSNSGDRMCAQVLTPLTEDEVYQYTAWLKMGKPAISKVCSAPTRPAPSSTPIPAGCVYKQVQCFAAPCDPILVCDTPSASAKPTSSPTSRPVGACTKDLMTCPDGITKVGRTGPNCEFVCPKPQQ